MLPGISDHDAVLFDFNLKEISYLSSNYNMCLYHKGDYDGIKSYMNTFPESFLSSDPYNNSVEQNWLSFKVAVQEAINKYIPQRQNKSSRHIPWINLSIKYLMKDRKQLYAKAKKDQTPEAWEAYRRTRNRAINNAHTDCQGQLFETSFNTISKKFWKYVKSLRKDCAGIALLKCNGMTISSSEDKAEVLNNQFYLVFTDEDISHIPEVLYSFPDMPGISFNTEGINKLLNELNTYQQISCSRQNSTKSSEVLCY